MTSQWRSLMSLWPPLISAHCVIRSIYCFYVLFDIEWYETDWVSFDKHRSCFSIFCACYCRRVTIFLQITSFLLQFYDTLSYFSFLLHVTLLLLLCFDSILTHYPHNIHVITSFWPTDFRLIICLFCTFMSPKLDFAVKFWGLAY